MKNERFSWEFLFRHDGNFRFGMRVIDVGEDIVELVKPFMNKVDAVCDMLCQVLKLL